MTFALLLFVCARLPVEMCAHFGLLLNNNFAQVGTCAVVMENGSEQQRQQRVLGRLSTKIG